MRCCNRDSVLEFFFSVSARIRVLQPHYFSQGVVSLWVGFPRNHRTCDGFARCRLCRMDLLIAKRGLSTLHEHWKTEEHQLREIKLRLQLDMPLLNKSCKPVSPAEGRRQRQLVEGSGPVHLESSFALNVQDVIEAERQAETADEAPVVTVTQRQADKLWLCQLVDGLIGSTDFRCVLRGLDNLTANFLQSEEVRSIKADVEIVQVIISCFNCLFLYVLLVH